jgi:hypothetical protein
VYLANLCAESTVELIGTEDARPFRWRNTHVSYAVLGWRYHEKTISNGEQLLIYSGLTEDHTTVIPLSVTEVSDARDTA